MGTVRQDGAQERRVEIYAEILKLHSLQESEYESSHSHLYSCVSTTWVHRQRSIFHYNGKIDGSIVLYWGGIICDNRRYCAICGQNYRQISK